MVKEVKILWLFLFICVLLDTTVRGEFRFCHYGPQRVTSAQCPYGIVFDSPISTSCAYFAGDGNGGTTDADLKVCQGDGQSLSAGGEKAEGTASFQAMFLEIADPSQSGSQRGKIANECVEECFAQWVPLEEQGQGGPGVIVPEEPFYDYQSPELKPWDKLYQDNLTVQLFMELLEEDEPTPRPPPSFSYARAAALLNESFGIMRKVCSPYIPKAFTNQIYRGFMFLIAQSREEVLDLGQMEYEEIERALDRCRRGAEKVAVYGQDCNNYTRITGWGKKGGVVTKYMIKEKSFRWLKYDPIIEGAWAAIDFVHGYCFGDHLPDFNYHHIYQQALEALFTKTILQRWPHPPQLKRGPGYWNNVLDAKDAKLMMQNVDACVQAGYFEAAHDHRLNRPFSKFPKLMGGSSSGAASPVGDEKPAHLKDASSYWSWYDRNNAWDTYLSNVGGTCIRTEAELNSMKSQFDKQCSS